SAQSRLGRVLPTASKMPTGPTAKMAVLHIVCGSSCEDGKYHRGFRTDTGQSAAGEKRDGSLVFGADCAQKQCRTRSPGGAGAGTYVAAVWPLQRGVRPNSSF